MDIEGDPLGAPAYHPRALLSVWLFGFMTGIRSSRKLEAACRDQIPYLWLTGWQHPDHNTLWRFYKESMRKLLRERCGLPWPWTWSIWRYRRWMAPRWLPAHRLVEVTILRGWPGCWRRLDRTIAELEDQNEGETDRAPVHLPEELANKMALRDQVRRAMEEPRIKKAVRIST